MKMALGLAALLPCLIASCTPGGATTLDGGTSEGGQEAGAGLDAGDDGAKGEPTANDIRFVTTNSAPTGEMVLFHDFSSPAGPLLAVRPDGTQEIELLRAYMLLGFDRRAGGTAIAFTCGFPLDAGTGWTAAPGSLHVWLHHLGTAAVALVGFDGTASDRCVALAPLGDVIYACRALNCTEARTCDSPRLTRIDLATRVVSFLTAPGTGAVAVAPTPDGSTLYYVESTVAHAEVGVLKRLHLATGTATVVRAEVATPRVSPDGSRVLFRDFAAGNLIVSTALDGNDQVTVTAAPAVAAAYSPDGAHVAYIPQGTCAIDVVPADGSAPASPTRIRDCATTGEQITDLLWTGP